MTEHSFELVKPSNCGKFVATSCKFDVTKFIRFSLESFPDFEGFQHWEDYRKFCLTNHRLEEFLLIVNAENHWVRTFISNENVEPESCTNTFISDSIIQSNMLLCYPYWSEGQDGTNTRVHFPSCMLEEAFVQKIPLKEKLLEWIHSGEDWKIGMHKREPQSTSKKCLWKIQDADADADVKFEVSITESIWKVIWRGATFIRKETGTGTEFEVVKRVRSHPNIVYGFNELSEGKAYFMEYMSTDLCALILERKRLDPFLPPFLPHETIDILLQLAEAMKHVHKEGVVHCDLKSENILIGEIAKSDNSSHYLVKVADFGSARNSCSESSSFIAGPSTDRYAAPEALRQRDRGRFFHIGNPDRIDVYSFGVVAFEVLTGENNSILYQKSRTKFREGVIKGSIRPPLREVQELNKKYIESQKKKEPFLLWIKRKFLQDHELTALDMRCLHLQDKELISLIESCWDEVPCKRPSFEEIGKNLNKAKDRLRVPPEGRWETDQQALDSQHRPGKRARSSGSSP